jgi:membrane associated rhomboid family serine protease
MFIPLGDDNSFRRRFPFVVYGLVAANAFLWYLQLTLGDSFTSGYSTIPLEITRGVDLITTSHVRIDGHRIDIPQAPGPSPIYLTLFSAMFMHGSWMHIIGNMLYLFIFGDQIEDEWGHLKFLLFYLLAGLGAAIAQISVEPTSVIPCLGASGAIAGVLGAYLVLHPNNRVRVLFYNRIILFPASIVLGFWGVAQILGQVGSIAGQHSGVAYMAHLGGFVVGLFFGFLQRFRAL